MEFKDVMRALFGAGLEGDAHGGHRLTTETPPGGPADGASASDNGAGGAKCAGADTTDPVTGAGAGARSGLSKSARIAAVYDPMRQWLANGGGYIPYDAQRQMAQGQANVAYPFRIRNCTITSSSTSAIGSVIPAGAVAQYDFAAQRWFVTDAQGNRVDLPLQTMQQAVQSPYHVSSGQLFTGTLRADPNAGLPKEGALKLGEISAWRAWRVRGNRLHSVYREECWLLGQPMRGDPNMHGVHAWKELQGAVDYIQSCGNGGVVGQVALWGDVVEHENGYRAEFAKITSLDLIVHGAETRARPTMDYGRPYTMPADLAKLRSIYLQPKETSA